MKPLLDLSTCHVTQESVRHSRECLASMVAHVAAGGFWSTDAILRHQASHGMQGDAGLIKFTRIEDGTIYLGEGHHRAAATWLARRTYLRGDEYELHDRSLEWFTEHSMPQQYLLTFNPVTHVRSADFHDFRAEVVARCQVDLSAGLAWRDANAGRYRRPRTLRTIPEYANAITRKMPGLHAHARQPELLT